MRSFYHPSGVAAANWSYFVTAVNECGETAPY
jgi:hypothetical protein